jgi:hypothetical protein
MSNNCAGTCPQVQLITQSRTAVSTHGDSQALQTKAVAVGLSGMLLEVIWKTFTEGFSLAVSCFAAKSSDLKVECDWKCSPRQVSYGALVAAVNVSGGGLAGWAGGFGSGAGQVCLDRALTWFEFVELKIG